MQKKQLPVFSYLGIFILLISTLLLILRIRPVTWFYTPLAWTGYILLIDGLVFIRKGRSLLTGRPGAYLDTAEASFLCEELVN